MAGFTAVKKKLAHLATASECGIVGEWTKSITNHLYLCSASVPNGDVEADDGYDDGSNDNHDGIVRCWRSPMDYLCSIHNNCYHSKLSSLEQRRKNG